MKKAIIFSLAAVGCIAGCDDTSTVPSAVDKQRARAEASVKAEQSECNECDNIAFKRITLGKPGLIGYVVFLSQDGRPIQYYTVKGKCTSGSKRLTQAKRLEIIPRGPGIYFSPNRGGSNLGDTIETVDGPSEDGTYGSSGDYIYCRTTSDAFVQWNGQYLYSTQPFDLTIKPLVVDLSGKEQGQ